MLTYVARASGNGVLCLRMDWVYSFLWQSNDAENNDEQRSSGKAGKPNFQTNLNDGVMD